MLLAYMNSPCLGTDLLERLPPSMTRVDNVPFHTIFTQKYSPEVVEIN